MYFGAFKTNKFNIYIFREQSLTVTTADHYWSITSLFRTSFGYKHTAIRFFYIGDAERMENKTLLFFVYRWNIHSNVLQFVPSGISAWCKLHRTPHVYIFMTILLLE